MTAAIAGARDTEVLQEQPRLWSDFARSVLPRRRANPPTIPTRAVALHHNTRDTERLAAYAQLTGFTLRNTMPPTWLHVLAFPLHIHLLADRESSVRLLGAVHVSNTMTVHRPVEVGEAVDMVVHVEALRPHRKGALVDVVATARVRDETVWTGASTYLAQGVSVEGDPEPAPHPTFEPATPHAVWRLPSHLGRQYRAVSRDPNPIHTSRAAARAFGFNGPIMHGMWTYARALATLDGRLPERYVTGVAFTKPVFLPALVGMRSEVREDGWWAAVTDRDGTTPHLVMTVNGAPLDQ